MSRWPWDGVETGEQSTCQRDVEANSSCQASGVQETPGSEREEWCKYVCSVPSSGYSWYWKLEGALFHHVRAVRHPRTENPATRRVIWTLLQMRKLSHREIEPGNDIVYTSTLAVLALNLVTLCSRSRCMTSILRGTRIQEGLVPFLSMTDLVPTDPESHKLSNVSIYWPWGMGEMSSMNGGKSMSKNFLNQGKQMYILKL